MDTPMNERSHELAQRRQQGHVQAARAGLSVGMRVMRSVRMADTLPEFGTVALNIRAAGPEFAFVALDKGGTAPLEGWVPITDEFSKYIDWSAFMDIMARADATASSSAPG